MDTLKKVLRKVLIGLLILIVLANIFYAYSIFINKDNLPMFLGVGFLNVLTGSMAPEIMPGDMIIIKEQKDYEVGDIITYKRDAYITHRIIEETSDGRVLKGDNNPARDDQLVKDDAIEGKVVFVVPNVGQALGLITSPIGKVVVILGVIYLMYAVFKKEGRDQV